MEPDAVEIRVLGCLIEKQRTTPDVYPLTLNALRLACNQSTNRDPVVDYDENTIRGGIERLVQRKWATLASWSNRRSMKYRQTLDGALGLDDAEISVLAVLMLRGPQTPGELKTANGAAALLRRHGRARRHARRGLIERRLVASLGQAARGSARSATRSFWAARTVEPAEPAAAPAPPPAAAPVTAPSGDDRLEPARARARRVARRGPRVARGARRLTRKRSVSLVIDGPEGLLLVRRPDDDEDLPGVWGLPAVTLAENESEEDAVRRAGRDKLGVEVRPLRAIGTDGFMTDWEAELASGEPAVPQPGSAHPVRGAALGRARPGSCPPRAVARSARACCCERAV